MSLLEQQMQELKLKQRKVALLKTLIGLMEPTQDKNRTADELQADTEVLTELKNFTQALIDNIEEGKPLPQAGPANSIFSEDEVEFLKDLYARAAQRGVAAQPTAAGQGAYRDDAEEEAPVPQRRPGPRPPAPPQNKIRPQKDLVAFAQEHRHMNGKRVIINTKQGKIGGVVTGVAGPGMLQVSTDTGHNVPVSPENITLE
jgi:hypothetical protein